MRRPGLWVANGHPGDPTQMLSWRPGSLTCYYDYLGFNGIYPYKAANPEATIIVRFQHQRNWQQNPAYFARQLGEQVASKWNDLKIIDPYIYFANENNLHYENGDNNASNQYLYTSQEFYKKYADWVRMTADIIKNIVPEMKLITPPFAFGHHEDGSPDDNGNPTEGWAGYDYLADTVRDYFDNILTFHAYWGDGSGSKRDWLRDPELSTWYAFRWQRLLKLFETRYNIKAKMIIDEAGNFGAYDPDFTDQVIYYAEKCLSDPRVLALTYFLWMDPTKSPGNLPNSWTQTVINLPDHLNRLRVMPDVVTQTPPIDPGPDPRPPLPEDQDTIRVLFDNGQVRTMSLEEYLRAVVPGEVPASWPAEAVKAQTIAARSYAQNAIENPRHNNADICTNPAHCQNYDESKIHERSDAAIQQTKGLIARYNGITVNGIFSANCGGHTRNNDDVFGGKPLPYLQGVACPVSGQKLGHGVGFCQQGARTFAQQGRTYEEIIKHYYTGVTLGPPTKVRTSNILGTILDYNGSPAAKMKVKLTGPGQTIEATSQEDGTFRFSNVPGGDYTLELPAQDIRQIVIPTPGEDTRLTLTLPAPAAPDIIVEVQRSPGLPLVIGNWGKANQPIRIEAPSRNIYQVLTGSKTEYGVGGFEFYAIEKGTYTLQIEDKRFEVPADGQTIRLTFRKGDGTAPSQPAGIIEGILRNDRNQAVANRRIELSGPLNRTTTTDKNGYFSFEQLPVGRYIVSVADSQIKQEAIITGQNRVALALKFAAMPNNEEWQITLERRQGLPLLVGDIGLANRPIVVIAPSRERTVVTSGHKPEWGRGGFEVYTKETGSYLIEFEDQRFTIPMNGQFTHVVFEKVPGTSVTQVRLVSKVLPRPQAETILKAIATANAETAALFEVVEG